MKTFSEVRNRKVSGKVVYDKRISRIPVKIIDTAKGFAVHIDGDLLDTFKNLQQAKKSAEIAIKELK